MRTELIEHGPSHRGKQLSKAAICKIQRKNFYPAGLSCPGGLSRLSLDPGGIGPLRGPQEAKKKKISFSPLAKTAGKHAAEYPGELRLPIENS
ncbi:MAG: hypothetical protein LBF21_01420 [Puniceicoccales bacterium]|jgi:hypothetical protein|nr:hypothetical protein [Puniceicoccales bacterium]